MGFRSQILKMISYQSFKTPVPRCVTKNGKFWNCSLFLLPTVMESSTNGNTSKTTSFIPKRICKKTFWGLDHDETHWFLTPNQWFSGNFRNFPGRMDEMGIVGTPSVGVWPKRHRIWAFQIHPGRSWKFEQKILSELGEILKIVPAFFFKNHPREK